MKLFQGNKLIGTSLERLEDQRFLTGKGQFVADLDEPGALHAAIFRSPIAHGRIIRLGLDAALALPGIHSIVTAADIQQPIPTIPLRLVPLPEFEPYRQPVIASAKVRYVGEPIAVVVANSRALAEDAIDLIEIEIESLPPVGDRDVDASGSFLFEETGTNIALHYHATSGDPNGAFATAEYTRKEVFQVQRHTAAPMETRGLLARWDESGEKLKLFGAAKVPYFNRRALARMMDLPETSLELIEVDVGGGFGVRGEFYPEDFLIPFVARQLRRPVSWIEDRREHLMATNHSRDVGATVELACTRDGRITGMRGEVFGDMGAYIRTNGGVVPTAAGMFLQGPYRIANVDVTVRALMTNKTPVGTYRGPGRFEANFFRERLFDMVAADLEIDPAEFRRINLIREDELPYSIGKRTPHLPEAVYDTGDYHAAFERCLIEIDWQGKAAIQGRLVDGRYQGVGIASFVESGGAGPKETSRFVLEKDGSITIAVGSSLLGQGLETTFSQIASDALNLPVSAFRIDHGSTARLSDGLGSYHGRSIIVGGSAVLDGAEKFRTAVTEAAANLLGRPNSELRFENGVVASDTGGSVSLAEVAASRRPEEGLLSVDGIFLVNTPTYSYGTHAAHVAVDPDTGHVEVLDYVAVEDVGRAINPMIVSGQAIGALVQGLGGVFLDHLIYDDQCQLLTASFADYLMPTATDFPRLRGIALELRLSPTNPLGAKSAGEGGMVPVAAAVGNAIGAALKSLGVQPRTLPLSPSRVWTLIHERDEAAL